MLHDLFHPPADRVFHNFFFTAKRDRSRCTRGNFSADTLAQLASICGVERLTMFVSVVRCWDWKKTTSFSPQTGHVFWARGN